MSGLTLREHLEAIRSALELGRENAAMRHVAAALAILSSFPSVTMSEQALIPAWFESLVDGIWFDQTNSREEIRRLAWEAVMRRAVRIAPRNQVPQAAAAWYLPLEPLESGDDVLDGVWDS